MDLSTHEDEIPIPISSTYVPHHTHSHSHSHSHGHSLLFDNNNHPPFSIEDHLHHQKKVTSLVKYRECLKNHAASIGGNATDGCGEFMPSGEDGTLEALKCSACSCHRNFHRKEVEGTISSTNQFRLAIGRRQQQQQLIGGATATSTAFGNNFISSLPRPTPHNMIMPIASTESDEMEEVEVGGGLSYPRPPAMMMRKRFRTKFSAEQKEKMMAFAEKAGWRLQRQEESVVQEFCQEIGVKRRVLKVWMHNNKHNLAKKNNTIINATTNVASSLDETTSMEGVN